MADSINIEYFDLDLGNLKNYSLVGSRDVDVVPHLGVMLAGPGWIEVAKIAISIISDKLSDERKNADLQNKFDNLEHNIKQAIREATEELKKYIEQQLDENTIKYCQSRINGMYEGMKQFVLSPDTNEGLLIECLHNINEVIAVLAPFGVAAVGPYVQAVSLRILVFSLQYDRFHRKSDLRILISDVASQTPVVQGLLYQVVDAKQKIIDGVGPIIISESSIPVGDVGRRVGLIHGYFIDNGYQWKGTRVTYSPYGNPEQRQRALDEVMARENTTRNGALAPKIDALNQVRNLVVAPINEVLSNWQALADRAQQIISTVPGLPE